mmetsp:Transcript_83455/g.174648  ORF Transcript_83455/g.174648 Transcript_83455/m.174648 type:complete len:468 (+) Transcript_83455:92-1495(+)|eukprot:CAMPEP_0206465958 /NCGR_PEP_ID=MMETSP0324_2-20121206/28157_1 /ASSEMBLY_ACC=CAM_ASM_000836 /TAXON_ID=2866 /ORGANISM="Crypthecodinium cohnii, Strain Seligo" /LENGTH=467 /DNA_ID=CAMNT_0053938951 /DNA_START=46 /DNA_END=1449 /DNA_ORIENTATION=-
MPGKRPVPLPDAIFKPKEQSGAKKKLTDVGGPLADDMPAEIPVHNTFIQFGAPKGVELGKQLSTAPAWIGPTLKSMIQSFIPPTKEPDDDDEKGEESESTGDLMASPMNIPVFRYSLSSTSARAAGVPASNQVVASYERWPDPEKVHAPTVAPKAKKEEKDDKDNEGNDTEEKKDEFKSELTLETIGDLPSLGSERHDDGLCKRCCFFPKGRCLNGKSCEFCHYPHEKRKRKKKKKKKSADKDGSDSEADSEVDEDQVVTTLDCGGSSTASPDRRRGGSSASESQVVSPSEKLQSSPAQGDSSTMSMTHLSNLDSIESESKEDVKTAPEGEQNRFHSAGEEAASPKNEGYLSMPSTASSVPNWPKAPFQLEEPSASSTDPSNETYTFTPGALAFPSSSSAPPVPPPPDIAPVSITADQRIPLYPPPATFADYDYTGDCSWGYRPDLAGLPTCPPAAAPTFSTRPPPR